MRSKRNVLTSNNYYYQPIYGSFDVVARYVMNRLD